MGIVPFEDIELQNHVIGYSVHTGDNMDSNSGIFQANLMLRWYSMVEIVGLHRHCNSSAVKPLGLAQGK